MSIYPSRHCVSLKTWMAKSDDTSALPPYLRCQIRRQGRCQHSKIMLGVTISGSLQGIATQFSNTCRIATRYEDRLTGYSSSFSSIETNAKNFDVCRVNDLQLSFFSNTTNLFPRKSMWKMCLSFVAQTNRILS